MAVVSPHTKLATIEDLFRLSYRPLCMFALHYLQDADLVEDVVQECFTVLWEKLEQGADVANRRAYLYMSVRNRCLDHLRRKGLPTESLKPYDTYGIIDDDDAEERSVMEAKLWTAIDSLPEKCRQVFLMSKRDGLKYEEIAEELGLSVNTVRNQISKALNVLKNGAVKLYTFILGIF
ncbi:MAG: RNA polymerase sigma-70 factor [Bacteroidales bacterium]|nr:RNA polymerase sigma-70 factor [Bacteroidales bacterium]